ncbi:MAG: hypothetical protein KatS3mg082_2626 [Nitrospiraceae bacterium]|nr:MAG: hypothetical protein KatS3mg082_2626 [Nitrospiraceae bacterium]
MRQDRSYRVHCWTMLRVPIDVRAASMEEALARAIDRLPSIMAAIDGMPTGQPALMPNAASLTVEWDDGEGVLECLIDEEGDPEYERSRRMLAEEIDRLIESTRKASVSGCGGPA